MLDRYIAARFVEALAPGEPLTLQSFDDHKPPRRELTAINGGNLLRLWPWIERQQAAGAGVFVTVCRTPAGRRKTADVTGVRALFVDFDGAVPTSAHLPPSIVVQSGRGQHWYWLVCDCPVSHFRAAQKRLILHYGSDPAIHDLPRVMRLPGTLHQKGEPVLVDLLRCQHLVYPTATVLAGLPALPAPPAPAPLPRVRVVGGMADCATFDAVRYFRDSGAHLAELAGGKHAVVCPWWTQIGRAHV